MATTVTACSGVVYTIRDDFGISVNGELISFAPDSKQAEIVRNAWGQWGGLLASACKKYQFPITWALGIMCQESGGKQNACSPCDPKICSFAPNCGGDCCAYGLMQMIKSTAAKYGVTDPEQLRREPAVSIDTGVRMLKDLSIAYGMDLVKIAAAYNAGTHKCRSYGIFGNAAQSQGDYSGLVVKFANTALVVGIGTASTAMGMGSSVKSLAAILGVGLGWIAFDKLKLGNKF